MASTPDAEVHKVATDLSQLRAGGENAANKEPQMNTVGNRWRSVLAAVISVVLLATWVAALPAETEALLEKSEYVYISSTRKDGSLGKPAEIWFLYHDGAVWVGTSPKSWRVKRIEWGRPGAKISVGKPDGPAFSATGEVVADAEAQALLMKTFAEKYPGGWKSHEEKFRTGFADGSRVLVKYTPSGEL